MSSQSNSKWSGAVRMTAIFAALAATVFIFSAGQIQLGNPNEFTTPFSTLASVGIVLVVGLGLFGAALSSLMSASTARRTEIVVAALTLLCWVQGTFFLWDYGVFDGSPIPWGELMSRGLLDSAVWIVGLAFAFYCTARFGQLLVNAAYAAVAIQAVALASVWLQTPGNSVAEEPIPSPAPMYEFSADMNVLHIVLDGFQSDIFGNIVRNDSVPGIEQTLEGFTFFADHMGTFPYTQLTVPLIVSGKVYQNDRPVADFVADVMRNPNVLNTALDAGFDVDIAAQSSLRSVYAQSRHTHAFSVPNNLHAKRVDYLSNDALRLADLSLFRVAPHFLRFLIHQDELWFLQRLSSSGEYPNLNYFADIEFLRQLRESMTVTRENPTYKLFHLMLSHRPVVGTPDCEFDGIRRLTRETVTDQSVCALKRVMGVIEKMKELGIYDDALIVLMGDHGAWVGPESHAETGDDYDGPNASAVGLSIPLLAIKPPNSSASLTVSDAPTNIGDVARSISELAQLDVNPAGRNVFELEPGEKRTRYFYDYAYGANKKMEGYLYTMLEYRIDGSPYEETAWSKNRRILPGGAVEAIQAD